MRITSPTVVRWHFDDSEHPHPPPHLYTDLNRSWCVFYIFLRYFGIPMIYIQHLCNQKFWNQVTLHWPRISTSSSSPLNHFDQLVSHTSHRPPNLSDEIFVISWLQGLNDETKISSSQSCVTMLTNWFEMLQYIDLNMSW